MLVAGFETTARLMFWLCYLLALDPAEQGRIRAELAAFPPERVAKPRRFEPLARMVTGSFRPLR